MIKAGVKACFVNLGADHASIIEAIAKGKQERPGRFPTIYTCPSEITAISMADGFARVTGRPQAVIAHVDVGTQALAHGIHNACVGRSPVFVFAGLTPFTEQGELTGSRTEYMHWLQDAPDQKAIVRQYCRYTGDVRTGLNVKQSVGRALQFAESDPKGPVYLASARETLAEEIEPYSLSQEQWKPIGPSALPAQAVATLSEALVNAERPLVVTGYSGRNRACPRELVGLADRIPGLRVYDTGGSDMCFPMTHRASQGFRLALDECTKDADVLLLLDCDVPWIPSRNPPPKTAFIYHVDVDPLNYMMPVSFFAAHGRWKADCCTALRQINAHLAENDALQQTLQEPKYKSRWDNLARVHRSRVESFERLVNIKGDSTLDIHNIGALLRQTLPRETVYVVEAVTCSQSLSDQIMSSIPGSWLNCGGTGIGWSNGAALGVRLALNTHPEGYDIIPKIVCQVVGDGSFLCSAPASAAWVAAKYQIPVLTIVLNNGGWNAPRASAELVYPDGLAAQAKNDDINISIQPTPNYAALAAAAADGCGGLLTARPKTVEEFRQALWSAEKALEEGKGALIEAIMLARP
ncbi:thiamine pyrophosphate enzyme [Viridothelium virens]|uniref:Thiamine pyrophosphate enzyme n=1 Tax=Viridothelium virens TaxID=1048519 RepID=A0A6A6H8X6_VIRVR|nr:thiamine pyrophosphate enzyme [Viridothelium virens]